MNTDALMVNKCSDSDLLSVLDKFVHGLEAEEHELFHCGHAAIIDVLCDVTKNGEEEPPLIYRRNKDGSPHLSYDPVLKRRSVKFTDRWDLESIMQIGSGEFKPGFCRPEETAAIENTESLECGIAVSSNFTYGYAESLYMEDIEARKLYINGEINETLMENITYYILKYNAVDKGIPAEQRQPILLYINSCGGSTISAMSLISTILCSKSPVYTINLGYNYSAGFMIMLAGAKRYSYKDSSFLLHDGMAGNCDNNAKVLDWAKFLEMQNKRIKDYIMSRSNITVSYTHLTLPTIYSV